MVVVVSDAGVSAKSGNFDNFLTPIPTNELKVFVTTTNSFWDAREGKTVLPIDLNIGNLAAWSATNSSLRNLLIGSNLTSVYVVDNRTLPGTSLGAVRVFNGLILPTNGLTVATARPLYVLGDYNQTDPAHLGTTDTTTTRPDICRALVRDLDRLPLALHVAGRLLRSEATLGWGIEDLVMQIRSGAAIIRERAPEDRAENGSIPTVQALLAKSTDLLKARTREYFAYLGVFAHKPATFDLDALSTVWQEQDPKVYVRELVAHGLLEPAAGGRFQMHALLVAHALSLLGN